MDRHIVWAKGVIHKEGGGGGGKSKYVSAFYYETDILILSHHPYIDFFSIIGYLEI